MLIQLCRRLAFALVVAACACTPKDDGKGNATVAAAADETDSKLLLFGDEAFKKKLQDAVVALGAGYVPRTRHKTPDGKAKYTNRLILETSPYLHQHAHNPVNWFPWGDEAFELAERLGRPVFLSVGYSTCHWCHVMEEESFEDEEIAAYLNDHYLCIKVDREERPDVDSIYMRAVTQLVGRGGWPMSVWLTPDRKPFYGGTYFPARDSDRGSRKGFFTLVKEQYDAFKTNPAIASDANRLAQRIKASMAPPPSTGLPGPATVVRGARTAARRYDSVNGGSRGRPKFPSNFPIRLLMRYGLRSGDQASLDMSLDTLRKMQAGGMYDHVGGGFHRYSTDARWLVPHFEKMLYDNALLTLAYLEGYQLSGERDLARVAREILDYIDREMTAPKGGYYSATDADSIGPKGEREEGYYFTWTPAELDGFLSAEQVRLVSAYYGVTDRGNFERRNILHTTRTRADVAKSLSMELDDFNKVLAASIELMRTERNKRPAPIRDDKIQVSWNGLMVSAMARGARVLGSKRYSENAVRAAELLTSKLMIDGRLRHSYKDGRTTTVAFAEDYAFLAAGLLDLFEATQQPRWLAKAIELMDQLEKYHANTAQGGYYRTANDAEKLLAREMETSDRAVPSSASLALMDHLRLWSLTTDDKWRERAETTMRAYATVLETQPAALDEMMLAIDFFTDSPKEIVLVLPDGKSFDDEALAPLLSVIRSTFVPNHVFVMTTRAKADERLGKLVPWAADKPAKGGKPTAYVCERGSCDLPTADPDVFRKQIRKFDPYPDPGGGG